MRYNNPGDPVYAPNSFGGPHADAAVAAETTSTYGIEDEVIRSAYRLHAEDDDFGQAGSLVRDVLNDEQRERLAGNIIGHASNDVSRPVLERVFEYWRNVDKDLGDKVAEAFAK
jgi:catalase